MQGYEKLAALISSSHGLQLFRKFGALQAKTLLYLQAELSILETQLADIMEQDQDEANAGDQEKLKFPDSWLALKQSDQNPAADNIQYRKIVEIRECLKSVDAALLQQVEINRLTQASTSDYRNLTKWLDHPDGGNMFLPAREVNPWGEEHFADLVCLTENTHDSDLFTRMWRNGLIPLYHRYVGRHIRDPVGGNGIHRYSDASIATFCKVCGTVLAALLPTMSIFALYFVKAPLMRLGMIMAFTATFTTTLAIFTRANMFEIFAASTAFAAVEVVFVGGNLTANY